MAEPDSGAVGVVAVANLVQLCKELRLPVAYKVRSAHAPDTARMHVMLMSSRVRHILGA